MKKKFTVILVCIVLISLSSIVFAMGEKPSYDGPDPIPEDYKTYVSKAGFSVSYPADWYLREEKGGRSKSSWFAFTLANKDPLYYIPPGEDSIEVSFQTNRDLTNSPSDINKKLEYFARKHGMRSIENIRIFKKEDVVFCLAYGMPRGYSVKYHVLLFYLPKSKIIASAIIHCTGKYSIKELLRILSVKIDR
ncbi:hypothetical protein KJ807_05995 [Patescibacteria group bacterium]|nr:hypothetical protein [Patescibacteria group bacterium]MBU1939125.1 hypothetical protein [Patescibacteria group bacterium]